MSVPHSVTRRLLSSDILQYKIQMLCQIDVPDILGEISKGQMIKVIVLGSENI